MAVIVSMLFCILLAMPLGLTAVGNATADYPLKECPSLYGRDGRDGRDGVAGPPGPPGQNGRDGIVGNKGDKGDIGPPGQVTGGGTTYVRWGRTTCPDVDGTELVYDGLAGKVKYSITGGGINYQCFPKNPEYSQYQPGVQVYAYAHGVEYWGTTGTLNKDSHDNAPCAVCYANLRTSVIMLPGKLSCPTGWTEEYDGYLMAERATHASASTYECVDFDAESIRGTAGNQDTGYFIHVEAQCTLGCPPYDEEKELTCVVCTK